jgi:hypothetical protein
LADVWIPPADLPSVDLWSVDESPFGVRGTCSGVPEWVRDVAGTSPVEAHLTAAAVERFRNDAADRDCPVRGWGGSARVWEMKKPGIARYGARCVIESE